LALAVRWSGQPTAGGSRPHLVGEYKILHNPQAFQPSVDPATNAFTSYSSHNPTLTRNLALIAWHSGGLQAIDIADPARPTQGDLMAGEASCWSSRRPSEDPRQPGRLEPAHLRGRRAARLPAPALSAHAPALRLLQVQPGTTHDRSTSTYCCAPSVAHGSPRACQPGVPGPRQDAGIDAHPHLLRHSLASAMAAAKEPASVIAGQLRHADGGTLASRTYIHQLPQTPPRLARLIEDRDGRGKAGSVG
jgi:hypothetical protein